MHYPCKTSIWSDICSFQRAFTLIHLVCVTIFNPSWERYKWYRSHRHYSLQWHHNGHDSVSNHQPHHCLRNDLFGRRSKKTSKLRVTGLCAGKSPGTGEFPAQMASDAENVSVRWRHQVVGDFPFDTWYRIDVTSDSAPAIPNVDKRNLYHSDDKDFRVGSMFNQCRFERLYFLGRWRKSNIS